MSDRPNRLSSLRIVMGAMAAAPVMMAVAMSQVLAGQDSGSYAQTAWLLVPPLVCGAVGWFLGCRVPRVSRGMDQDEAFQRFSGASFLAALVAEFAAMVVVAASMIVAPPVLMAVAALVLTSVATFIAAFPYRARLLHWQTELNGQGARVQLTD